MNENIKETINDLIKIDLIPLSQIPDIDLYMYQITTFAEDKLNLLRRNNDDKILTKTMINNYTKAGLISPPNKKKYSKKHIISLIMIYYLKSILSINDIKIFLSKISDDKIEEIYKTFINIQENEKNSLMEDIMYKTKNIILDDNDENTNYLLTVLMLINEAYMRKQLAEKIIDKYLNKSEKH